MVNMELFGCAMTSPETVTAYLTFSNKKFTILPSGIKLKKTGYQKVDLVRKAIKKCEFLLVLNFSDFKSNIATLNGKLLVGKKVVLFAPTIRFLPLKNCKLLDVETTKLSLTNPFIYRQLDFERFKNSVVDSNVEIEQEPYVSMLVNTALEGSVLSKLMTLIYQIPNSKTQNEYRDHVVSWFVKCKDETTIGEWLSGMPDNAVKEKLVQLINQFKHYKTVFKHIAELESRKRPVNIPKICEKFQVSEFDLRYMLNIAGCLNE